MQWWVWVLIGVAVIGIGVLKIKVLNSIMKKRANKRRFTDD